MSFNNHRSLENMKIIDNKNYIFVYNNKDASKVKNDYQIQKNNSRLVTSNLNEKSYQKKLNQSEANKKLNNLVNYVPKRSIPQKSLNNNNSQPLIQIFKDLIQLNRLNQAENAVKSRNTPKLRTVKNIHKNNEYLNVKQIILDLLEYSNLESTSNIYDYDYEQEYDENFSQPQDLEKILDSFKSVVPMITPINDENKDLMPSSNMPMQNSNTINSIQTSKSSLADSISPILTNEDLEVKQLICLGDSSVLPYTKRNHKFEQIISPDDPDEKFYQIYGQSMHSVALTFPSTSFTEINIELDQLKKETIEPDPIHTQLIIPFLAEYSSDLISPVSSVVPFFFDNNLPEKINLDETLSSVSSVVPYFSKNNDLRSKSCSPLSLIKPIFPKNNELSEKLLDELISDYKNNLIKSLTMDPKFYFDNKNIDSDKAVSSLLILPSFNVYF